MTPVNIRDCVVRGAAKQGGALDEATLDAVVGRVVRALTSSPVGVQSVSNYAWRAGVFAVIDQRRREAAAQRAAEAERVRAAERAELDRNFLSARVEALRDLDACVPTLTSQFLAGKRPSMAMIRALGELRCLLLDDLDGARTLRDQFPSVNSMDQARHRLFVALGPYMAAQNIEFIRKFLRSQRGI